MENATDEEQTYTVTLLTTDRTPADRSAEFTSGATELAASGTEQAIGQIVVPANSTAELLLTLKVGPTLGLGDAKMILELEGTPTIIRSRMISGITAEIENLLLETGSDYSMQPYLDNTVYNDVVTLDPSVYLAFANEMTNVKLVIWNKGPSDGLSPDEIDIIKNTENVNNFICGDGVIGSLVNPDNLIFFGLEFIGWNLEAQGSTFTIRISGQEGDVITGNLGENIEGHLIQYYVNMVRITDTENVFPIMHFQDNGFRQYNNDTYFVSADNAIFGIRSTKNNARTVLLGMSPYTIADENVCHALVNNILDWLVGQR